MIGERFLTRKDFDLFVKNLNHRLKSLSITVAGEESPPFILGEFIELIDTPAAYAGKAKNILRVNAGEDALVFKKFEYDAGLLCYIIVE